MRLSMGAILMVTVPETLKAEGRAEAPAAAGAEAAAGAPSQVAQPAQAEAQVAGATAGEAAEPIRLGGLVHTAIGGLLKALWAALVGLLRRIFGRARGRGGAKP